MYSRDETVAAVSAFYQQIIKHPYLDNSALIVPPASGWDSLAIDGLKSEGKTDTVIDLLRHLPYLCGEKPHEDILVYYETLAICYAGAEEGSCTWMDQTHPLPGHCVFLTSNLDREGYSLIMDTERGTITAYSIMEYSVRESFEVMESMPLDEKWRCHLTLPVTDFFGMWTRHYEKLVNMLTSNSLGGPTNGRFWTRTNNYLEDEKFANQSLSAWHPDVSDLEPYMAATKLFTATIYNTYLEFGWPANFDKDGCRERILRLSRKEDRRMHRWLDGGDPTPRDEDEEPPSKVRKATGGIPPRKPKKGVT
ncbi:hypothetical protein D6D22_09950 [Aureobasidium pullulans]|uniref:Uncharacterized protein n=1 Tax=Aureobasidium pullulans TaxID=5580 RepID=A0A4S8X322_AURPU|nr:hypothetical protein D6D22_09950 [Aureobasidium pullulans]THW97867.1 hypothetical protein D6D15_00056 [Aureobasidium pullulans]TIA35378.1 hypothetical protein D6C79_08535 [Aureobasidium pullulans]